MDLPRELLRLGLIALGGGVGAVLRHLVNGAGRWSVARIAGPHWADLPLGTLVANGCGSLLLGYLAAFYLHPERSSVEARLAITVGLLGGFTTFSSYAFESVSLGSRRTWIVAVANVLLNNGIGLAAAWAGYRFGQRLHGH